MLAAQDQSCASLGESSMYFFGIEKKGHFPDKYKMLFPTKSIP